LTAAVERMTVPSGGGLALPTRAEKYAVTLCPAGTSKNLQKMLEPAGQVAELHVPPESAREMVLLATVV
jgi:hypothetical protein